MPFKPSGSGAATAPRRSSGVVRECDTIDRHDALDRPAGRQPVARAHRLAVARAAGGRPVGASSHLVPPLRPVPPRPPSSLRPPVTRDPLRPHPPAPPPPP